MPLCSVANDRTISPVVAAGGRGFSRLTSVGQVTAQTKRLEDVVVRHLGQAYGGDELTARHQTFDGSSDQFITAADLLCGRLAIAGIGESGTRDALGSAVHRLCRTLDGVERDGGAGHVREKSPLGSTYTDALAVH